MNIFDTIWHRKLKRPYRLSKVIDEGEGQSVVLLHGLASSSTTWKPLVNLLDKKDWRITAFDLLGFGSSPKPDWKAYRVEDHVQAVLAAINRARLKKPIVLIGHSMGCLVATHIAYTRPRLIKRLVLYQPPLFADIPEFQAHMRRRNMYFKFYKHAADKPHHVMAYIKLLGRTASRFSNLLSNKEALIPFKRSLKNTILEQRAYEELTETAIPTDIISGRLDVFVTNKELKKMFAQNPCIKLHKISETHYVNKRAGKFIAKILTK
ncbi:hypothetical protein BH23PAT1_BH23PAT1_4970 [soil metagenome]